jgi:hypothetical protein
VANAWDAPGHQQVADIAWSLLKPETKKSIRAILQAGDPAYAPADWTEEAGRTAFRRAAVFPDRIKSDRATAYESIIPEMNRKWQPDVTPDSPDREAHLCKTWHYYDQPIHVHGEPPALKPSSALVALPFAIEQLRALRSSPGAEDRKLQAWWLYWVEHLTGDLHQPLHCTSNCDVIAAGDAGGNLFHIRLRDDHGGFQSKTLHSYWDEGIDHAAGRHIRYDADLPAADAEAITRLWLSDPALQPSDSDLKDLDVSHWIKSEAALAEQVVYTGVSEGTEPAPAYVAAQTALCKRAAVLAGRRLAAILEAALKP